RQQDPGHMRFDDLDVVHGMWICPGLEEGREGIRKRCHDLPCCHISPLLITVSPVVHDAPEQLPDLKVFAQATEALRLRTEGENRHHCGGMSTIRVRELEVVPRLDERKAAGLVIRRHDDEGAGGTAGEIKSHCDSPVELEQVVR